MDLKMEHFNKLSIQVYKKESLTEILNPILFGEKVWIDVKQKRLLNKTQI